MSAMSGQNMRGRGGEKSDHAGQSGPSAAPLCGEMEAKLNLMERIAVIRGCSRLFAQLFLN